MVDHEIFTLVGVLGVISVVGAFVCNQLISEFIPVLIGRKMAGRDLCKKESGPIPEPLGIICAAVWMICQFAFLPFPILQWANSEQDSKFFLVTLLSILSAIMLGFCDDMFDLRWRYKLIIPTISSLPVLTMYYISGHSTSVVLPPFVSSFVSHWSPFPLPGCIDIGLFYYVYMGMLKIFCMNSINIYAGINGLEVGQSIVVAASVLIFNFVQLFRMETEAFYHSLSIYILLPFLATSLVLYKYNRYPARVFVGDTYCYWAGMTLGVAAILGHFSKTMLLFLVPQVLNFLYSIPQLFKLVPCPRHRLPKYDPETDLLGMSYAEFKSGSLNAAGAIVVKVLPALGLLYREEFEKDGEKWTRVNNFTVINLMVKFVGPVHEATLTNYLLLLQIFCSGIAFFVRFGLASMFYEVVY